MIKTSPQRRPSAPPGRRHSGGAANDNARFRIVVPTSPARLARYGTNLLRLNPYLRLLGDALSVLELFQNYQGEGWDSNINGWTRVANCSLPWVGPPVRITQGSTVSNTVINLTNSCTGGQAFAAGSENNPFGAITSSTRAVAVGTVTNPTTARCRAKEYWSRPNSSVAAPKWQAAKAAIALPAPAPSTWPLSIYPELAAPGLAPAFPPARPWRLGSSARGLNSAASYGAANDNRVVSPSNRPSQVPNDWSVSVEAGPAVRGAPTTHILAPPTGARGGNSDPTKERKIKLSPAFVIILKAVSMATEGIDFVNAIYDALPPEYRPKFRNTDYELRSADLRMKMHALFENADKIDIEKALRNLAAEQFEDYLYGQIGKFGGEVSKSQGLNYGAGFNSLSTRLRKYTYDIERKEDDNSENEWSQ